MLSAVGMRVVVDAFFPLLFFSMGSADRAAPPVAFGTIVVESCAVGVLTSVIGSAVSADCVEWVLVPSLCAMTGVAAIELLAGAIIDGSSSVRCGFAAAFSAAT